MDDLSNKNENFWEIYLQQIMGLIPVIGGGSGRRKSKTHHLEGGIILKSHIVVVVVGIRKMSGGGGLGFDIEKMIIGGRWRRPRR